MRQLSKRVSSVPAVGRNNSGDKLLFCFSLLLWSSRRLVDTGLSLFGSSYVQLLFVYSEVIERSPFRPAADRQRNPGVNLFTYLFMYLFLFFFWMVPLLK